MGTGERTSGTKARIFSAALVARLQVAPFPGSCSLQRATVWPSALDIQSTDFSAHAEAEDRKLRKDPTFGGPCFEGTLQKPTGVSESSPVAGTTLRTSTLSRNLDAGRTREIRTNTTGCHTSALGELFIADECRKAQEGI